MEGTYDDPIVIDSFADCRGEMAFAVIVLALQWGQPDHVGLAIHETYKENNPQ